MDITLIANIVYGVSIALIVLFALIGFFKGFWKSFIAAIIQVVLMVISIFAAPALGQSVGSINLTSLGVASTATVGDITFEVTSIRETICSFLTASGYISPVQGQTIYQAALAVTDILLSLVCYVLMCFLSVIISWLLALLIYHTMVKWFIPKRIRTKRKVRWAGAISGGVMGFFAATLAIAPLSSVASFVRENSTVIDTLGTKDYLDDDLVLTLDSISDSAYSSGWLGGMDAAMLDSATAVDFNGEKVSFSDLLSLITGVAAPLVNALNDRDYEYLFNYTVLMSPSETIDAIFDTLIDSNLIMGIMPALCEAALSLVQNGTGVDLSGFSFEGISFGDELESLRQAYLDLYSTGLIDSLGPDGDGTLSFDESDRQEVVDALRTLGSMEIVSRNMPDLMVLSARYVQEATGYSILSFDREQYVDIDWGEELATLGSAMFDLADAAGLSLSVDLDTIQEQIEEAGGLFDLIIDRVSTPSALSSLRSALVGDSSKTGIIGMQVLGTDAIDYSQAVELMFARVPSLSVYIDKMQVFDTLQSMSQDMLLDEVGILVDVLPDVATILEVSREISEDSSSIVVDLGNQEQMDAAISALRISSQSQLVAQILPLALNKSLPALVERWLGSDTFLGLSASSFDLSGGSTFFDDLIAFIEVAPDIMNLVDALSNSSSLRERILALDPDGICNVLKAFVNSSVFNPDRVIDGQVVKNTNLVVMLDTVLEDLDLSSKGLRISDIAYSLDWSDEADALANLLQVLQDNIDIISSSGSFDLDALTGDAIEELVLALSESQLLSDSMPDFLESQITERTDILGLRLRFSDIEDWTAAAAALGDIWDLAKPYITESVEIDYTTLDYSYVNALMTALYNSGFVPGYEILADGTYSDPFGTLLYNLGLESGIFADMGIMPDITQFWCLDPETGEALSWSWSGSTTVQTVTLPDGTTTEATVSTSGEIFDLCWAFQEIAEANISDVGTADGPDADQVYSILCALDRSHIGFTMLPDVLTYVVDSLGSAQISGGVVLDFTDIDIEVLTELEEDGRYAEYWSLSELYRYQVFGDLSSVFTMENLLNYNTYTDILSRDLGPNGEPVYMTVKEVVDSILDFAFESEIMTSVRHGHRYSFAVDTMAAIHAVIRTGQMSMGYGTSSLTDDGVSSVYRRLKRAYAALAEEEFGYEREILDSALDIMQDNEDEGFSATDMLEDPAGYITPDNVDYVVYGVIVPLMVNLSTSYVVYEAPMGFETALLQGSSILTMIYQLNGDLEQLDPNPLDSLVVDAFALGLGRGEQDEEIEAFYSMMVDLLEASGADSMASIFVDMFDYSDPENMLTDTLDNLAVMVEVMEPVRSMDSIRAWVLRGVYNSATYSGVSFLDLIPYAPGLDADTDPYKVISIEYQVYVLGQLVPGIIGA